MMKTMISDPELREKEIIQRLQSEMEKV